MLYNIIKECLHKKMWIKKDGILSTLSSLGYLYFLGALISYIVVGQLSYYQMIYTYKFESGPAIYILLLTFLKESPVFLIRQGKDEVTMYFYTHWILNILLRNPFFVTLFFVLNNFIYIMQLTIKLSWWNMFSWTMAVIQILSATKNKINKRFNFA